MAKDRTTYIFNENTYGKGRLVLAVVEQYVSTHPGLSKEELEERFPAALQGSMGVVSSIEEAEGKYKAKRHFVKSPIKLTNATIVVCSQWGADNLDSFLQLAIGELGYTINKESEAEDESNSSSDVVDMDVIVDEINVELDKESLIEKDKTSRIGIWRIFWGLRGLWPFPSKQK